jgi:hypothetical protein
VIKSKLREIAIVLTSLIVLSGGVGTDAAYARDGGFPYERFGSSNSVGDLSGGQHWASHYAFSETETRVGWNSRDLCSTRGSGPNPIS